jgi:YidC/Oxa1 family membrane protein insertase
MWTWIKDAIWSCVEWAAGICGDWGLGIILITIIIRLLIFPLQQKQLKSTYNMQKVQPKILALQEKYKDDQQKLSEETMKIYSENKFNPLGGCLPMLLQMPIFIALFQALRENLSQLTASFYNLIPNLSLAPNQAIAGTGDVSAVPYIILGLAFAACSLVPMILQQLQQNNPQTQGTMKFMIVIMSAMMLYFGYISPAGVLLYWALSSLIGACQQIGMNKYWKAKDAKLDAEVVEVKPVVVDVVRKEKKKKPTKKSK